MLGKRKRDTKVVSRRNGDANVYSSETHTTINPNHDIFRRHFEAAFAPLPDQLEDEESTEGGEDILDSEAESEVSVWSGLSESGKHAPVVEVIDHTTTGENESDEFHRARQKAFMVRLPVIGMHTKMLTLLVISATPRNRCYCRDKDDEI